MKATVAFEVPHFLKLYIFEELIIFEGLILEIYSKYYLSSIY